jgi:hypothetical protein
MAKNPTSLSSLTPLQLTSSPTTGIIAGRVTLAITDNTTDQEVFENFGEWSSIGCIFFEKLNEPNPVRGPQTNKFARPLFPNNSSIPLKNEIIYVISLPDANVQSNVNSTTYYYFQPINIWGSTHHNAIPDPITQPSNPESQTQDYQQTEAGAVRRVSDGSTEIDLGNNFTEKLSVRNLQPYPGDLIYQGRWGQSLRFSSTVQNAPIPNPWSDSGEDGDAITIIRNGQYEEEADPWIPQVENINEDKSSIYLTSTQKIPIEVASDSYKSYNSSPESPQVYAGNQIILDSGRLLFNAKSDAILLTSNDTINLNSINSVNIDTQQTVIQSPEVLLGDKSATESLIFGDKFLNDLSKLLSSMISLSVSLQTPIGTPVPFVPNGSIVGPAAQTQVKAQNMLNKINDYKSKISKTK